MMRIAMAFMLLFFTWPKYLHLSFGLGEDWIDGLRGMLLGIAMGFLILVVRHSKGGRCCDDGRT
ncbi:MAG TPA: hypothetical protein VF779_13100 [Pyrinomonadaceae bacterium]